MHVGQGELEGLVGQDAGHVGKAQQAVVGEHRAQAQGAGVQQRFMRLARRQPLVACQIDGSVSLLTGSLSMQCAAARCTAMMQE